MEKDPHNLYLCPNIIRHIKSRGMKWTGHVAHMGEGIKVYNTLVRKPEGKRPLGKSRRWWKDGIRMDLKEIGCVDFGVDSVGSGLGPVTRSGDHGDEPWVLSPRN
jgi:hypothetical protein